LFLPRWVHGFYRVADVFLLVMLHRGFHYPFTENGTDPILFPSAGNEADRTESA
jgi:hypothetical protein